ADGLTSLYPDVDMWIIGGHSLGGAMAAACAAECAGEYDALALLGAFVFDWPVMTVYILMSIDEIIKVPFIYPRYKKYLWLTNLTREENA
ncbi:MAG: hypothetical protein IJ313_08525, partial [Clostridia bacterium]|nr:hypothetical protein [Clostridia bacterium]